MPFSTDDLENVRKDLAQLPQNRPKSVNNRDAVAALRSELAKALNLGYSVDDLAQLLSGKGLQMTAGTLKGYLQQARKKKRSQKKTSISSKSPAPLATTAGTTSGPAASTIEAPTSSSLTAGAKATANGTGDPRPTPPAIWKGTVAAPPPTPPTPRRA
jgi:hypothetical protein